jgi:hypothetical protein
MTIDKIYSNGNLSVRSYHACKYNAIETIEDLKNYFSKNKTFKKLRNCGEKSNTELIQLCHKFPDKPSINNITLNDLYHKRKLSVQSYNVCKYSNINTLIDLKNYYNEHKTFINLYKCGEASNIELTKLSNNVSEFFLEDNNNKRTSTISSKINSFNRPQRQVVNQFIKITSSQLKVRGQNAIKSYIGKSLKLSDFLIKIFDREDFQVAKIKNIGKGYIPELETYLDKIKTFINEVSNISNEKKLISLNNKFLIQHTFSIDEIPDEILANQSIIKLCEFLILKNAFFKPDYTTIFHSTIDVFNSDCKTLDETAIITNLSRERVRQIRQRCFEELENKISFLKNFEDDFYQNYDIDISESFIILTDEKVEEINFLYDTKISRNFLKYIFSVYLSEQFSINGNLDDVLIPKQFNARNRHNWKNIYIIRKEIKEEIDVNKICEDISSRLLERINETYKFNFKSYLSRFLLTENFNLLENIKDYCEDVINKEFDLFLDLDDNIVFERNTLKTASEYAFDALDALGKPSKVEEIYLKITELFPGFNTDSNKVRASLKRKDGFVPIGRKSIYGLQKWENELDNFKGGTIRSIVKELLDKASTPLHISEITKYVLQYRPKTNEYSIIQNLKLDESKMFKFFENAVIGVSGKEYESSFNILNSKSRPIKRSWEESYNVLLEFIKTNKKLPSSSNCPESEEILYRWFNVQKSKINLGQLSDFKIQKINEVLETFPNRRSRTRSKGTYNLNDLIKFIESNNRLPKATIEEEQKLYNFFYRKRKLHKNKELSIDEYDVIDKILNKYSSQLRSKSSLPNRYEILLNFVKKNKRLPSAKYENEQNLYQFFYKQRKLYEKDELDNELTTLFLSIAKEIQNTKYENTRN